jgi:hypothetical protein
MYIADMFCYGRSTDFVGVNGIVGCMGVFVSSGATLYAVHIPDSINYNQPGRVAFAQFVTGSGGWNAANATMVAVLNNDNRPAADAELTDLGQRLGIRSFRLVRLRKNIDLLPTKEPQATAVVCLFNQAGNHQGIDLRYQMDKNVRWNEGHGEARSGQYRAMRDDARLGVNAAWGAGWQEVNGTNCSLSLVKL